MARASFIIIVVHDMLQFDFRHQATDRLFIMCTYEVMEYFCQL